MNKFAVITAFLGETRNRYMVYQGDRTLTEKFAMAKSIPGLDGLELCYPSDFENPAELKALLRQYGFGLAGMNFRSRRGGGLSVRVRSTRSVPVLTTPSPAGVPPLASLVTKK